MNQEITFGILSLVPPLVVILLAMWLKRSMEPLLIGCAVGYLMIDWHKFPDNFIQSLTKTMQDESLVWVILVCGLYGALIHLMVQSGGAFAFGKYMLRYIRSRRSSMLMTWLLGIILFIDDYLSALVVGTTMRKITDHFRVPREHLAYLVNATAAPVCVLIPMSTWSIYAGKLIEDTGVVGKGQGFMGFVYTIPYSFYAWFAILLAFLFSMGWLPMFGRMKRAQTRVDETGELSPPNSKPANQSEEIMADLDKARPAYFFLPILVLIATTLAFDIDALKGVMATVIFTIVYYWIKNVLPYETLFNGIFEGFKTMLVALAILTFSYILKNVGTEMGLTQYVIESVRGVVSKEILAALVFVSMGLIAFSTASSWGLYAIAIPIVVPLAQAIGANVWLTLAAVISAGAMGSNACFFSDDNVLTASSTECNNMEHAISQFPYVVLAAVLATGSFLAMGFWS